MMPKMMTTKLLRTVRPNTYKAFLSGGLLAAMWSATVVSTGRAEHIDLTGRTAISDSEAKEFAEKSWDGLYAKDVTEMSDEAIVLLAGHKGALVLRGLPDVSLPAAKALGQHEGMLNVGGSTLGDEVIEQLARNRGELGLNVLKSLSARAANSLAKHHDGVLGLGGLESLSLESSRGLAPHVGVISLSGITALPEAVAAELARGKSELYFVEHKSLREDTRVALSGHCGRVVLSFVELPQYFPPDVGWRAEAATENVTRQTTRLIDEVIDESLGTETKGEGGFTLSGVRWGMHLRDLHGLDKKPNALEEDPTRFLVPAPGDNGNPRPASPVCVRVDSLTGEIVCVEKVFFNTAVGELVDDVVNTYGKTKQEIEMLAVRGPGQLRKQTAFRYTFPNELVRVSQVENLARGGAANQHVSIWLCSRKWTERNLRSYANAVLTACAWAKAAMKSCDGGDFDATVINPLPGTKRNTAIQNTHALFADTYRSELLDNKAVVGRSDREGRGIVATPIVAAVGKVDGMLSIVICPFNSTVAGFRPLSTLDQLGSAADIRSTHAGDLLKHVGNSLVQAEFPPATEQIQVVREVDVGKHSFRLDGRGGVAQLNTLFDKTDVCRYEWVAENGWTVRVCFDGALCFFRKPQKRLD